MGINKRIEEIMNIKNLNYRSFGLLLNYSDTQVRNIIIGKSVPKVDFIEKLVSVFPEINVNWIITGNGTMHSGGDLASFNNQEILDYIIENSEDFRNETKIDAVAMLFLNFEQQRELKKMYDRLDSYEALLQKIADKQ